MFVDTRHPRASIHDVYVDTRHPRASINPSTLSYTLDTFDVVQNFAPWTLLV